MLKLILGLNGSGKTKKLIEMVNEAVKTSTGSVVCIEKSDKLRYDVSYQCRLISTDNYSIFDSQSLYGFIAGIYASNHDITDIYIDAILDITGGDIDGFDKLVDEIGIFAEANGIHIVITATIDEAAATDRMKKYI
ncbi:MAG: hypothetical protein LUE29_08250 [Lachnospiraceae bacterium]|nr:hypothetical protein [Lachnospiraceae bacterium]